MSGKMFPSNQQRTSESRIPILSPTPFRRHNSLRLKGEIGTSPYVTFGRDVLDSTSEKSLSQDRRQNISASPRPLPGNGAASRRQSGNDPPLQRGDSFMERGDKRATNDGGKSTSIHRPASVKISTKPPTGISKATVNSPQSPGRIRSLSLSLSSTRLTSSKSPSIGSNPVSPAKNHSITHLDNWDNESITSIGSSVASCEHASVARNGTTFSGRSMKYVFHCSQNAGISGEDYLTPTQRAHRQVKKLKYLLHQAKKDLEQKDSDILKLTKEVVELRLYKAALSSPEDKSNSSDAVTYFQENPSEETTPDGDVVDIHSHLVPTELNSSFADSGHFDDGTNSSIHSNDDFTRSPYKTKTETSDKACSVHIVDKNSEQSKLIMEYEKRIQELIRAHEEETYHLKQKHNDKVEELLQRITEINARYWELVPELDSAKEKIKELESQLEEASRKLEEQEKHAKKTYLDTSSPSPSVVKEPENAVMEIARQHPNRVSVPELLNELQVTKNELENIKDVEYASTSNHSQPLLSAKEALSLWVLGARKAMYRQLMEAKSKNKIDPEITLQFLRSAIYYFLTDKENNQGHLKAIQSILGFTPNEIANIDKARLS
ncbi:protein quick-to-court-like isoform X2 [Rhynchophorus ferrugineus]|uniref:protein quick-to-court-like isoform X2 n=1 Tax=Rhynchophorus ferrugineus TaxID=354439 RepID=UPI003FCD680E